MGESLESLFGAEAGPVWRQFAALCAIPRPSGQEEAVRRYVLAEAARHGWETRLDAAGNVVLAVPGRGDLADAPPLILQGHLDMVCEANSGTTHDFTRDPIAAWHDGEYVRARGTTLGADNGIGVALALAAAEAELPHRLPLELLFTVDEETGLTGANRLDPGILRGRRMLNLDSEEDGAFTIGCAGGVDLTVSFAHQPERGAVGDAWCVQFAGLRGGHSGADIHQRRRNAIRAAARLASDLEACSDALRLHSFDGGNKKNAIPREARLVLSGCDAAAVESAARTAREVLRVDEPTAEVRVQPVGRPACAAVLSLAFVEFLMRLRHGVLALTPQFPGLVRTSNSVGVARTEADRLVLTMHGRSSHDGDRRDLAGRVGALARSLGGTIVVGGDYPGWEPNPDSQLLAAARATWRAVHGADPAVHAVHAGLEAGIIGAKLGTTELLAAGPAIDNAHSPDERLSIASLARTWRWLAAYVGDPGLAPR